MISLHKRYGMVRSLLSHISFGYEAYVHAPKENRSKLDKKAQKCIFIGYKYGLKGHNIWNPESKKVVYI
jgi:hypothetical protein